MRNESLAHIWSLVTCFLLLRFRQLELTVATNSIVQTSLGLPCDFSRSMALKRWGGGGCVTVRCGAADPPLKPCRSECGFDSVGRPRAVKLRYCTQTLRPCGTPKGSHSTANKTKQNKNILYLLQRKKKGQTTFKGFLRHLFFTKTNWNLHSPASLFNMLLKAPFGFP